jgi:hypothetical protein
MSNENLILPARLTTQSVDKYNNHNDVSHKRDCDQMQPALPQLQQLQLNTTTTTEPAIIQSEEVVALVVNNSGDSVQNNVVIQEPAAKRQKMDQSYQQQRVANAKKSE